MHNKQYSGVWQHCVCANNIDWTQATQPCTSRPPEHFALYETLLPDCWQRNNWKNWYIVQQNTRPFQGRQTCIVWTHKLSLMTVMREDTWRKGSAPNRLSRNLDSRLFYIIRRTRPKGTRSADDILTRGTVPPLKQTHWSAHSLYITTGWHPMAESACNMHKAV